MGAIVLLSPGLQFHTDNVHVFLSQVLHGWLKFNCYLWRPLIDVGIEPVISCLLFAWSVSVIYICGLGYTQLYWSHLVSVQFKSRPVATVVLTPFCPVQALTAGPTHEKWTSFNSVSSKDLIRNDPSACGVKNRLVRSKESESERQKGRPLILKMKTVMCKEFEGLFWRHMAKAASAKPQICAFPT